MQISITGRHLDITDSIKDRIHKKLERDLSEFPKIEYVHIILSVQKYVSATLKPFRASR